MPEAADALYRRLHRSLDSLPEHTVPGTCCARYAEAGGFDLPTLIPQVCLHYDPYTRKSGGHSGALCCYAAAAAPTSSRPMAASTDGSTR